MNVNSTLILRICHDLITPCNAINLGVDTLSIAGEDAVIDGIRESAEKANSILKYLRELFGDNEHISTTAVMVQSIIADFLDKYKIIFSIDSKSHNISGSLNKILLFNGVLCKEIMPLGGQVKFDIDENETIVIQCKGMHLVEPSFDFDKDTVNYRSIMRYYLKQYLSDNNYIMNVDRVDDGLIILEKKI